nr:hypothetical protein [Tanacetum cinerariifolium]
MQTQTSNTLHNAIMEAGSKDRPPMLAPGNYVQWKSRIKRYIDTKPNHELIHYCLENPPYKLDWKDIEVPVSEGSPITTTARIHETYKNVTFYKMMNDLIRNQCKVTDHQVNVQFLLQLQPEWQRSQQAAAWNRGKAIVNSPQPIYDQEPSMVAEDDETSKDKEIDKLMALISLSSAGYENQRNGNVTGAMETKPKRAKDAVYHREKMLLCKQEGARIQLNAEQADWRDDTDNDELEDQELEAHYMYMAQLQEVSPDAADSGPIFDDEPLQKGRMPTKIELTLKQSQQGVSNDILMGENEMQLLNNNVELQAGINGFLPTTLDNALLHSEVNMNGNLGRKQLIKHAYYTF